MTNVEYWIYVVMTEPWTLLFLHLMIEPRMAEREPAAPHPHIIRREDTLARARAKGHNDLRILYELSCHP